MLSDIKVLKFVNGEIVIGQVTGYDKEQDSYTVLNPITIQVVPDRSGNVQVAAQPWPTFVSDDVKSVEVNGRNLIISPYAPVDQIRDMYNAQFGSGLVLPSKSLVGV